MRSSIAATPSKPPLRRTHTPLVYSAADAAALRGFSRSFETPVLMSPRADFAFEPTRSTVFTTGRGSLSMPLIVPAMTMPWALSWLPARDVLSVRVWICLLTVTYSALMRANSPL